jgi:hypothetical protein
VLGFRIRCRVGGFVRLKNGEAGVCGGGVVDDVEKLDEVFPIVLND